MLRDLTFKIFTSKYRVLPVKLHKSLDTASKNTESNKFLTSRLQFTKKYCLKCPQIGNQLREKLSSIASEFLHSIKIIESYIIRNSSLQVTKLITFMPYRRKSVFQVATLKKTYSCFLKKAFCESKQHAGGKYNFVKDDDKAEEQTIFRAVKFSMTVKKKH